MRNNLRLSESDSLKILECTIEGILIADLDGKKFKYANHSMCNMLGYNLEEILQLSVPDIHPSNELHLVLDAFEKLAEGKIQSAKLIPCKRKDGSIFYADITASQINIDQTPCNVGFFADVTERKIAEDTLKLSEQRYKIIANLTSDYIYKLIVDVNGEISLDFVSDSFYSISGKDKIKIKALKDWEESFPAEEREKIVQFQKELISKRKNGEMECRSYLKDKKLGWVLISAQPEWDEQEQRVVSIVGSIKDITKRKKVEEILNEFIDKNPLSIQLIDKEGNTYRVNAAHTKFFGSVPPPNYSVFSDPALEKHGVTELMERAKNGEMVYFPDMYYNAHDLFPEFPDNPVWLKMVIFPILGSDGKPEHYVLMHEDITARKNMENELLRLKSFFEAALDQSPIGIQIAEGPEIHLVMVNKAAEIMSGVSVEKQLKISTKAPEGLTWSLFYPDGTKYSIDQFPIVRSIRNGEVIKNEEILLVQKDGTKVFISVNSAPIRDNDGNIIGGIVAYPDITERKKMEEALRISEERLSFALSATNDGIWDFNVSENLLFWSPRYFEMLGYRPNEIIPSVDSWSAFIHPDDILMAKTILNDCLNGKIDIYKMECRFKNKQGRYQWILIRGKVVGRDKNGKATRMIGTHTDISNLKWAEKELQKARDLYQNVVETQSEMIARFTQDGVITFVNNAWQEYYKQYLGLNENVVGKSILEIMQTKDESFIKSLLNKLRINKSAISYEREFKDISGKLHWQIWQLKEIESGKDSQIEFQVVGNDITEKKNAEIALQKSEVKFKSLIDLAVDAIVLGSHDGFIIGVNQKATELTGYTAEELIGKNLNFYFSKEEMKRKPFQFDLLKQGKIVHNERILTHKSGRLIPIEMNAKMMPDGTYQGFLRDITKRKQAEESLFAEKERLAVTLRSIGDGVITTDTKGCVVIMNKVAENLTGWSQEEAIGKPLNIVFNIVNETTRNPIENPVEKVLLNGKVIELANHTLLVSKNGSERLIADSGAPIRDKDNIIQGVVLVFRDITEKQKLMETAQKTQKLESLGILAGGIAHDFNNLLSGIFGYIDLANRASKESKVINYLQKALAAMNRARGLTQQLLTFAKGGVPVRQLNSLFPFIQETVEFALSGSNVTCRFDIEDNLWLCDFDKNQIGQVIDNIIINAQQSMPMGGVITISAVNLVIKEKEYASLTGGNYVKISIKDKGIGIPKDILPRIFDPFFTTKQKGHGLGLAVSYSIIIKHGGFIDVESEPGVGSTFHVFLPALTKTATLVEEKKLQTGKGSGRILVVDDEDFICDIVSEMLDTLGYSAVCLREGKEAIKFFKQERSENRSFNGIILDLTIPGGMGGKDTIKEIRKIDPYIPVFASSGYADDPLMSAPNKFGFTCSISKPFKIEELEEMLNKHLSKHK